MNKENNKSVYADNAQKRTIRRAAHKAARSVCIIIRKLGEGLVEAARVWTSSSVKEGA